MDNSLRYPIGIQDFPKLREGGFVYVDKTMYLKRLVDGAGYYFLSRPRRFGKSLFLSTVKAFFEGRRELFKGLAIDTETVDWTEHPVFMFSFNTFDPRSEESILRLISNIFSNYENVYGQRNSEVDLPQRFENLIESAFERTGRKVVILIDEYDAPILATLDRPDLNNSVRFTLKALFSVLKSSDRFIRFALVTGVSRFSQTSLFSGANNLDDISVFDQFGSICGITEQELISVLMSGVREFALSDGTDDELVIRQLKENYDGYHFSERCPDIYNPFSLLNALNKKKITDYWFQSGTPSFLIGALKRDDFFLPSLDCIETLESDLSAKESYLKNPVSLLYETGYITIRRYDEEKGVFTLGLPNQEVATSFTKALLPVYSGRSEIACNDVFMRMRTAVIDGKADRFMELLKAFMHGNPYGNTLMAQRETYFRNNIYLIFRALGFVPRAEEQTCDARMDVMLRTRRFIYIFELKTDGDVDEAMDQIEDKGYAEPYRYEGLRIIRIAANYSTHANNIEGWRILEE